MDVAGLHNGRRDEELGEDWKGTWALGDKPRRKSLEDREERQVGRGSLLGRREWWTLQRGPNFKENGACKFQ